MSEQTQTGELVSMKNLLEAGVHFGHQKSHWNPRMKSYIFGARNGIHIIDLQQTVGLFKRANDFIKEITKREGVLFRRPKLNNVWNKTVSVIKNL